MDARVPAASEVAALARLWHDGWHEAHAHLVPEELTRLRTVESFRQRLAAGLEAIRVVGPPGAPWGFCWIRDGELFQLFVASGARGGAVARTLLADGEARLRAAGVGTAWLACAIGNERAARFYEKCGWRRTGVIINDAETSRGPMPLEVWRYEKVLD